MTDPTLDDKEIKVTMYYAGPEFYSPRPRRQILNKFKNIFAKSKIKDK